MGAPDVTVVIAVYNTMPYLTECLDSVLGQTIGIDRLEVVAVDDGSTDDSPAELDRYAERYPGTVTVIHQANSGGPAAPSNRALEVATGRYVFFLGADDRLGSEALQRLVRTADELEADIVLGKLVGVGGRGVFQAVYARDRDDITLVDSPLPWALSNTKLFRRSMVEEHHLRFPEDLKVASDQPFTIRAVVAARRIAVRGEGYDFYYAVLRSDASNITYSTSPYGFLQSTVVVMDTAAQVISDPEALMQVHRRHFTWELGKLLGKRFLDVDRAERQQVQDGVRKLAEQYLTGSIRDGLDVQRRIPLSVAQYGSLEDLVAVVEHFARDGLAPLVVDGERCYAALPGFRDPARDFPDSWFDASAVIGKRARTATPIGVAWGRAADGRPALVVDLLSAVPELDRISVPPARLTAGEVEAALTSTVAEGERVGWMDPGTRIRAEFRVADLVAGETGRRSWRVRFAYSVLGKQRVHDLRGLDLAAAGRIRHRHGLRFFAVRADQDRDGRLVVVTEPIPWRRLAGGLARRLGVRRPRPQEGPRPQKGKTPA